MQTYGTAVRQYGSTTVQERVRGYKNSTTVRLYGGTGRTVELFDGRHVHRSTLLDAPRQALGASGV